MLAPASVAGTDLTSPISPTDMSVNGWDQHSQSNPTYVNGNATDEYQIMSHHQPQQPMFHHDYYQSQGSSVLLPMELRTSPALRPVMPLDMLYCMEHTARSTSSIPLPIIPCIIIC